MEHRPRILIIENEKRWQQMLTGALQSAGYDVEQAFFHGEALSKLEHREFDLVIVDLDLPGSLQQARFEGEDILDELKTKGILSIVVTGFSTPEHDRKLLREYGRYGMLMIADKLRFAEDKSFLHEGFPAMVQQALEEAKRARRADGLADDQLERLAQVMPPSD